MLLHNPCLFNFAPGTGPFYGETIKQKIIASRGEWGHSNLTYTILNYSNFTGYVFTKHTQSTPYKLPLRRTPSIYPDSELQYLPDQLNVSRTWCLYHGKFGWDVRHLPDGWFFRPFGYVPTWEFFMRTKGIEMLRNPLFWDITTPERVKYMTPFEQRDASNLDEVLRDIKKMYYRCMNSKTMTID